MKPELNAQVIEELRRLKSVGEQPSMLLNYIRKECAEDYAKTFTCMLYFRAAFDLSLQAVSPIQGWENGEISDERINKYISEEW